MLRYLLKILNITIGLLVWLGPAYATFEMIFITWVPAMIIYNELEEVSQI